MTYRFRKVKLTSDTSKIAAFRPGHLPMTTLKVDISHSININDIARLDDFKILAVGIVEELESRSLERQAIRSSLLANVETKVHELADLLFGKLLELRVNGRTTHVECLREGNKREEVEERGNFHDDGFRV